MGPGGSLWSLLTCLSCQINTKVKIFFLPIPKPTAFCSCCTDKNWIPAGSKMSNASIKALPTIPKTCLVPWATMVSTKASLEVIFVFCVLHAGVCLLPNIQNKTGVISDPLGQTPITPEANMVFTWNWSTWPTHRHDRYWSLFSHLLSVHWSVHPTIWPTLGLAEGIIDDTCVLLLVLICQFQKRRWTDGRMYRHVWKLWSPPEWQWIGRVDQQESFRDVA